MPHTARQVRLASVVALPTAEELQSANVDDAGIFMLAFKEQSPDKFDEFVARRRTGWCAASRGSHTRHALSLSLRTAVLPHYITSRPLLSSSHQVFVWSRIRSVKDTDDRQEMRIRHLFFEDFLEAIVTITSLDLA